MEDPTQIVDAEALAVTIIPLTFIVTVSVDEQPFKSLPVTVYVVADDGEATGFEMAALSSDAAGVHK